MWPVDVELQIFTGIQWHPGDSKRVKEILGDGDKKKGVGGFTFLLKEK